jgi:DNA-binding response OmpR family regulator
MTRVVVVEDDPDISHALDMLLSRRGYEVVCAPDGRSGLRAVHDARPDLLVLDISLPYLDGWAVLERVRDMSDLPVLLLTAHGQESDKVRGLRSGADDYLTKPFSNAELLARVEALLRRIQPAAWSTSAYDDGVLHVDPATRNVQVEGRRVTLTVTEFRLLNTLVRNAGRVLSQSQLLNLVWDDPSGIAPERVKFAVLRLRRKLGWVDASVAPIESVRGIGYRYRPPTADASETAGR